MTEDNSKKIQVKLDHEQTVIHLDSWIYDLKGVLIAEATEEDKKKYYCGKYMTYPIVDDDWQVREDECITDGIKELILGKKGDTIPLIKLKRVLTVNARERYADYSDFLVDAELHGLTVSNRREDNPQEELPEIITLEIYKYREKDTEEDGVFLIESEDGNYFIPRRDCHIGTNGILYQGKEKKEKENEHGLYNRIVYLIAEDVRGISWFFNKPNLRVRCLISRAYAKSANEDRSIPDNWHIAIKTLEDDINNEIAQMRENKSDDYFRKKRPIL